MIVSANGGIVKPACAAAPGRLRHTPALGDRAAPANRADRHDRSAMPDFVFNRSGQRPCRFLDTPFDECSIAC